MEVPLVSVYICTYNRSVLLKRAVMSAFDQSYKNVEVVVCSDNSQDDTDLVMHYLMKTHKNLKYIKNPINSGACVSRNNAIKNCTGDYITGLDDDDYFYPRRVEAFIENSSLLDKYSFLSSSYYFEDKKHKVRCILNGVEEIDINKIAKKNIVGNQIFTLKRRVQDLGGFDEELPAWQDHEMWLRLISKHGAAYRINEPTYLIDTSHDHERISKNINKINVAFEALRAKYNHLYSDTELYANLKMNVYAYPECPFNLYTTLSHIKYRGLYSTCVVLYHKLLKLKSRIMK